MKKHISVIGNSESATTLLYSMLCNSLDNNWTKYDKTTSMAKALNYHGNTCTENINDVFNYNNENGQYNKIVDYIFCYKEATELTDEKNIKIMDRILKIKDENNVYVIDYDDILNNSEKVRKELCKNLKISLKGKGFTNINNRRLPNGLQEQLKKYSEKGLI